MTRWWRRQSRANPSLNAEFPASREFTGNFIDSGPHGALTSEKKGIKSERYEPIPYASEQGIFCGHAGNLNRRSGKFPLRSGNPALVRYLGRPDRPIRSSREISNVAEKQRGTPPDARVAEGPGMRKIARRARDARLAVPGLRNRSNALGKAFRSGGTESSNPACSSGESGANSTPRFGDQRPVSSLGRHLTSGTITPVVIDL